MQRKCVGCGANLREDNPGTLCPTCQIKKLAQLADRGPSYYTAADLTYILGLENEESVKRLGRKGIIPGRMPGVKKHLYLKEAVDAWIKAGNRVVVKPTSPIQAEAYALCIKGNHSWMHDEKYDGQAYQTIESPGEINDKQCIVMSDKRACYFCGHIEIVRFL